MTQHNRLQYEKSPYLLQHKDNPVNWHAWGEEAFKLSREKNKPIFLSIGYSTCHWCHVMAHESFENAEVAAILNEYFIPVKVDREERPDVDEIYMAAIHAMGQRGGWPLSMFLTTDLKPFYGGTYWPRDQFLIILEKLALVWKEQPEKIFGSGDQILESVKAQKNVELGHADLSEKIFQEFYRYSSATFDRYWGGFGHAPKFPHTMQLALLLRIYRRTQETHALKMVTHSLEQMARGGIYDHVGGGFARYSTDERWLIPHFEKMLYDNALLVKIYLEAYQVTKNESFAQIAEECLDYILRDMTHPEGGFYSAEDADSEGEEGKFYVWTFEELKSALTNEEFEALQKTFDIKINGNFEHHTNNLALRNDISWADRKHPLIQSSLEKLFKIREKRIRPHLDDKILTSWNGLMISAMALGYQILKKDKYLEAALKAYTFILNQSGLYQNEKLFARYRDGESRFSAYLDDYAYLIQGILDLYECNFDTTLLKQALELQKKQDELFWDHDKDGYFFSDGSDSSLLVRSKEGGDGAIPNGNAVSALNLQKLYAYTFDENLKKKTIDVFRYFSKIMVEYPHACPQMLIAYDYFTDNSKEIVIASSSPLRSSLLPLHPHFIPNKVIAWTDGKKDFPPLVKGKIPLNEKTTYYICETGSCLAPTNNENEMEKEINKSKSYHLDS